MSGGVVMGWLLLVVVAGALVMLAHGVSGGVRDGALVAAQEQTEEGD